MLLAPGAAKIGYGRRGRIMIYYGEMPAGKKARAEGK